MSTPNIALAPMLTSTFAGGFEVSSFGLVQGVAMDDPAVRFALAGGVLDPSETLPMWGGVGIYANVPTVGSGPLGPRVGRATSLTPSAAKGLIGFSSYNQATAALTSPQSPAPTMGSLMTVPYWPLGSGARLAVAIDPSLAATLQSGVSIGTQVSWDFNNQLLQPYDASTATYSMSSVTSSYNATTGVYTFVCVAAEATPVAAVGDSINISGITSTGAALVNGNQTITSFTDDEHFSFQVAAAANAIATGALAGTIVLNYGTGALPCTIERVEVGNSKVVAWDPVNLVATWNPSGAAALIRI